MENHPIPQDITGFQFKLIGDMTVKQFAYIAGGSALAWVAYILPIPFVVRIPIILLFVLGGFSLAFVPIQGRPMDLMIKNFFKAVFSPTQFIYQKMGGHLLGQGSKEPSAPSLSPQGMLKEAFGKFQNKQNKLDQKETVFLQSVNQYEQTQSQPSNINPGFVQTHEIANQPTGPDSQPVLQVQQAPNTPAPKTETKEGKDNLKEAEEILEKELKEAKAKEESEMKISPGEYSSSHQKVLELEKSLNDLLLQKQQLESKLLSLQKQMETAKTPVFSASSAVTAPPKETKFVRSIPTNMAQSVGLPTTPENPNVITGILKDPRGNPLANILVEVKDKAGNAVRAFKTNALGQFASATPLTNGEFTIEFEDPNQQNKFDAVAFKAEDKIILPIEVISVDQREELRRSLFN